jgi:phage antirepressor YoqD-like protein
MSRANREAKGTIGRTAKDIRAGRRTLFSFLVILPILSWESSNGIKKYMSYQYPLEKLKGE